MTAKQKHEVKAELAAGELDLIIGTHALFSEDVEYKNLALVITDEQHRFGRKSALEPDIQGRKAACSRHVRNADPAHACAYNLR